MLAGGPDTGGLGSVTSKEPGLVVDMPSLSMNRGMARVTASIDDETLRAIREIVGPRGVSAFLRVAARERLMRLRVLGLLDELDEKHGAPGSKVKRAVAADAARLLANTRKS